MTTIIITECQNPYGKYWTFRIKGTGRKLAEVDRVNKKSCGYTGYKVYAGEWPSEVARHSNKDMAMEFARQSCQDQISDDIEFKWNVNRIVYKYV